MITRRVESTVEQEESIEAGSFIHSILETPLVILSDTIHSRQLIIVGKNTTTTLIITKTPSPVFSRFILP